MKVQAVLVKGRLCHKSLQVQRIFLGLKREENFLDTIKDLEGQLAWQVAPYEL